MEQPQTANAFDPARREQTEKHIRTLGIIFICWGVLSILFGILMIMFFGFISMLADDPEAAIVLRIIGTIAVTFTLVTGIPEIIGGWGLLKKFSWSRILVIIMAAVNVIDFPLGTALGIYGFWVLFKEESKLILIH